MQIRSVLFIVGVLLVCVGASLVLPLGVSLWYGDGAFLATQKSYACRDTLKNLQTRLRRFPFERIHKSFIVNTKFISCLQSDSLILQDGTVLPVSKHKMAPMRHYLKLLMESSLL